jgi:hypothetical protein
MGGLGSCLLQSKKAVYGRTWLMSVTRIVRGIGGLGNFNSYQIMPPIACLVDEW